MLEPDTHNARSDAYHPRKCAHRRAANHLTPCSLQELGAHRRETERLQPLAEKERVSLLIGEAKHLANVDKSTPADDLIARISRIEAISESLIDGADKDLCDSLAASLMDIHDQQIMAAVRPKFGTKPSWNTDTSKLEQDLR